MPNPVLLTLSGSLRRGATNRRLLHEAVRLFGDATHVEADLDLPLYDGDVETGEGIPASVQILADQISAADAVLISTPEYNKGPSGVLKNALDWVSRTDGRPFADKPVAVMSAASGQTGGERAQLILRAFLVSFRPRVLVEPVLHLGESGRQFDPAGHLINDQHLTTLVALMQNLRSEIEG